MRKLFNAQHGETIMEVLVCVGIVGVMMTSAFALSNRNQASARASYERNEAVKIGETQLEKLRYYADRFDLPTSAAADTNGKPFCVIGSAASKDDIVILDNKPPMMPTADTNLNQYKGKRATTGAAAECSDGTSAGQYRYAIWPPGTTTGIFSPDVGKYLITVRWVSATGVGNDSLDFFYEIFNTSNPQYGAVGTLPECRDGRDNDGDALKYKGGIDYPADLGCSSADDVSETNPACNDGIDNADPEDSLADYSVLVSGGGDPGCTSLDDNDETDPPEIIGFATVVKTGASYTSCTATETKSNDGNDGCLLSGNSMFMRRQAKVTYDTTGAKPGKVKLEINYREYGGDSTGPWYGYPGYNIKLTGGGVDTTLVLPSSSPDVGLVFTKEITFSSEPSSLSFEWTNNNGSDPDFQIDSIKLSRP